MGDTKKHHFVPRFILRQWTYDDTNLWLYLKHDIENSPRSASVADVGLEKNLYTSRGGDKSVETEFFRKIDGNASAVIKKILENKKRQFGEEDKISLIHFVNTFHIRSPEFLNSMKDFNGSMRKRGEIIAEKKSNEIDVDNSKVFKKEQYDDSPKIMQIYSTIGEGTAMSELYENDFNKLMTAEWMIYENNSNYDFITSDFPLQVINLSNENSLGIEIPSLFGMILPLSPKLCLIISNVKDFITKINTIKQIVFVKQTNISTIQNANIQIFAKQDTIKKFIKKNIKNY